MIEEKQKEIIKLENFSIKDIIIFNIIKNNDGISIPNIINQINDDFPKIQLQQSYVFSLFEKLLTLDYLIKISIRPRLVLYKFNQAGEELLDKLLKMTSRTLNIANSKVSEKVEKAINSLNDTIDNLKELL